MKRKFPLVLDMKVSLFGFIRSATNFDNESCEKYAKMYLEIIKSHDEIDCNGVKFKKVEDVE